MGQQCTAKSKQSGERCKRHCAPGKTVCYYHGGKSNGAPKGNKNRYVHGAYSSLSIDTMTEEEIEYANSVPLDPLYTLEEQLKVLRVKEARVFKRMKKALDDEKNAGKDDGTGRKTPRTTVLTVHETRTKNAIGEETSSLTTMQETHSAFYMRLDQVHSSLMEQIRRVVEAIAKIRALDNEDTNAEPPVIKFKVIDARKSQ